MAASGVRLTDGRASTSARKATLLSWACRMAAKSARSLGVIAADRRSLIAPGRLPEIVSGQLFLISLEPAGGSPNGLPTGPVLYGGPVVAMR